MALEINVTSVVIRIDFSVFQEVMAPKRNATRVAVSIDYTCSDRRSWYLDIHGLEGAHFHKVHLFIAKKEDDSLFEDHGQIVEACVSIVDGHPDVECIDILDRENQEFQLSPGAYVFARMTRDKDMTMFSRGWKIEESSNVTADELQSSIIAVVRGKKIKASQPPAIKQSKVPKVVPKASSSILDTDNASLASSGSASKMRIVDPDILEAKATKGQDKDTGGMNKYINYFPFQYKEFDVPVQNCLLAPDHFNTRIMDTKRAESVLFGFSESTTRPAACAYLMPVKNAKSKEGIPMKVEEVEESKLQEYKYWILDGQHSIYAAKVLLFNQQSNEETFQRLIDVYKFRKARIVVNAPPFVATAISAIANDEAKALYVKQPYSQILRHLQSQWIFSGRPTRAAIGIAEGHVSRAGWDVSDFLLFSYSL